MTFKVALNPDDSFIIQLNNCIAFLAALTDLELFTRLHGGARMSMGNTPIKNTPAAAEFHDFSRQEIGEMAICLATMHALVEHNRISFARNVMQTPPTANIPEYDERYDLCLDQMIDKLKQEPHILNNVKKLVTEYMPVFIAEDMAVLDAKRKTTTQFLGRLDAFCAWLFQERDLPGPQASH